MEFTKQSPADSKEIWSVPAVRENSAFEEFYKHQNIVPLNEWEVFVEALRSDLPLAFRVVDITPHRHYIKKFLFETIENLQNGKYGDLRDGSKLQEVCSNNIREALRPLKWFKTGKEAFQMDISRHLLRSCKPLLSFHRFLVAQSEAATIFRQEAVSMIPALFLEKEMRSDSLILDMCSAPGSKTSQLLEALHLAAVRESASTSRDHNGWPAIPKGAVVANDADTKRAHMLIHHLRHLNSPCLLVVSHAAQYFPTLFDNRDMRTESNNAAIPEDQLIKISSSAPRTVKPILFDGILCDVPCSGDGTLRKCRSLWSSWSPHQGLGCHRLQLQILLRGIKLCKVGGRIVYSTCALNPIENEAVVNAAVNLCEGAVELEDCSKDLPALRRRPGVRAWDVFWEGVWYRNFSDVPKTTRALKKVRPSMFATSYQPQQQVEGVPLERCMRFLPHDNNTGGFFVAVLRKIRHVTSKLSHREKRDEVWPACPGADADSPADEKSDAEREGPKRVLDVEAFAATADQRNIGHVNSTHPEPRVGRMQVDMLCLGWPRNVIENQHRQLIEKDRTIYERTEAVRDSFVEKETEMKSVLDADSTEVNTQGFVEATPQVVIDKTVSALLSTLDIQPAQDGREIDEELKILIGRLYVRVKGPVAAPREKRPSVEINADNSADSYTAVGSVDTSVVDGMTTEVRCPRTINFVSDGVKFLLDATGLSRYKVVNAGCPALQTRATGLYRVTSSAAQWLAPCAERRAGYFQVSDAIRGDYLKRHVVDVSCSLLHAFVSTSKSPPRVQLYDVAHLQEGRNFFDKTSEGPLLLLTKLESGSKELESIYTKLALPAWRGRTSVELMLDHNTRYAMKCLLDEWNVARSSN